MFSKPVIQHSTTTLIKILIFGVFNFLLTLILPAEVYRSTNFQQVSFSFLNLLLFAINFLIIQKITCVVDKRNRCVKKYFVKRNNEKKPFNF